MWMNFVSFRFVPGTNFIPEDFELTVSSAFDAPRCGLWTVKSVTSERQREREIEIEHHYTLLSRAVISGSVFRRYEFSWVN